MNMPEDYDDVEVEYDDDVKVKYNCSKPRQGHWAMSWTI